MKNYTFLPISILAVALVLSGCGRTNNTSALFDDSQDLLRSSRTPQSNGDDVVLRPSPTPVEIVDMGTYNLGTYVFLGSNGSFPSQNARMARFRQQFESVSPATRQVVELKNTSDELHSSVPSIDNPKSNLVSILLENSDSCRVLEPGAICRPTIVAEPYGFVAPGEFIATLNAAGKQRPVTIGVVGSSIETNHRQIDFGSVIQGAQAQKSLQIRNWGSRPVDLSGLNRSNAHYSVSVVPAQLGVGQIATVHVLLKTQNIYSVKNLDPLAIGGGSDPVISVRAQVVEAPPQLVKVLPYVNYVPFNQESRGRKDHPCNGRFVAPIYDHLNQQLIAMHDAVILELAKPVAQQKPLDSMGRLTNVQIRDGLLGWLKLRQENELTEEMKQLSLPVCIVTGEVKIYQSGVSGEFLHLEGLLGSSVGEAGHWVEVFRTDDGLGALSKVTEEGGRRVLIGVDRYRVVEGRRESASQSVNSQGIGPRILEVFFSVGRSPEAIALRIYDQTHGQQDLPGKLGNIRGKDLFSPARTQRYQQVRDSYFQQKYSKTQAHPAPKFVADQSAMIVTEIDEDGGRRAAWANGFNFASAPIESRGLFKKNYRYQVLLDRHSDPDRFQKICLEGRLPILSIGEWHATALLNYIESRSGTDSIAPMPLAEDLARMRTLACLQTGTARFAVNGPDIVLQLVPDEGQALLPYAHLRWRARYPHQLGDAPDPGSAHGHLIPIDNLGTSANEGLPRWQLGVHRHPNGALALRIYSQEAANSKPKEDPQSLGNVGAWGTIESMRANIVRQRGFFSRHGRLTQTTYEPMGRFTWIGGVELESNQPDYSLESREDWAAEMLQAAALFPEVHYSTFLARNLDPANFEKFCSDSRRPVRKMFVYLDALRRSIGWPLLQGFEKWIHDYDVCRFEGVAPIRVFGKRSQFLLAGNDLFRSLHGGPVIPRGGVSEDLVLVDNIGMSDIVSKVIHPRMATVGMNQEFRLRVFDQTYGSSQNVPDEQKRGTLQPHSGPEIALFNQVRSQYYSARYRRPLPIHASSFVVGKRLMLTHEFDHDEGAHRRIYQSAEE